MANILILTLMTGMPSNAVPLRALFVLALGLACASCASKSQDLAVDASQPPVTQRKIPDKDAALLKEGKPVNDYVNQKLPSQITRSLYELNNDNKESEFPAIQDTSKPDTDLLTLEERRKLLQELEALGGK